MEETMMIQRGEKMGPGGLWAPGSAAKPRRILVVDDNPEFREVLAEHLRGSGFEVAEAGDGEETLSRIPEFHPEVVLLDIRMPGLSGLEVLRRIKAMPEEPCVVIVSGNEDVAIARRALAMGAADYVTKPVNFGYVNSVLATHLAMRDLWKTAKRSS